MARVKTSLRKRNDFGCAKEIDRNGKQRQRRLLAEFKWLRGGIQELSRTVNERAKSNLIVSNKRKPNEQMRKSNADRGVGER